MAFIFVPLETISYTFRAVSLGVRLWVNMLAGHTLLHILTGECRAGVGGSLRMELLQYSCTTDVGDSI